VKVFARLDGSCQLADIPSLVRQAEDLGLAGMHVSETIHDPFMVAALALANSTRLIVRTSVALAFVRSPLLTAYSAWDLSRLSGGRFHLGLGTQIRQNIEDRYGMPWSAPSERMSEYIDVVETLFSCFRTGAPPRFRGRFYRATRLQPHFNPGPDSETQTPPIWLGGVNRQICEVAGEKAAGFMAHSTNSHPAYLRELCIPNISRGAAKAGRSLDRFEIFAGTPFITALSAAELAHERERQRRSFAFLYSTPAYKTTLEQCGFDDLQPQLQALVRSGRWDDLPSIVTDRVLDEVLPSATYAELPSLVRERLLGIVAGFVIQIPSQVENPGPFRDLLGALADINLPPVTDDMWCYAAHTCRGGRSYASVCGPAASLKGTYL
jgi:probable F420-dependent oxidoreductase